MNQSAFTVICVVKSGAVSKELCAPAGILFCFFDALLHLIMLLYLSSIENVEIIFLLGAEPSQGIRLHVTFFHEGDGTDVFFRKPVE